MAEPTRAAKPGRFALRSPRCREGAVPGASAEKPPKRAFYLPRMKPPKEPAPNNNNNSVSFVIHSQLGKEIKHICSNCSRGEDARDGECRGPVGGGGSAGRRVGATPGVCSLESCGDARRPEPNPAGSRMLPKTRASKQLRKQLRCSQHRSVEGGVPRDQLKEMLHLLCLLPGAP